MVLGDAPGPLPVVVPVEAAPDAGVEDVVAAAPLWPAAEDPVWLAPVWSDELAPLVAPVAGEDAVPVWPLVLGGVLGVVEF